MYRGIFKHSDGFLVTQYKELVSNFNFSRHPWKTAHTHLCHDIDGVILW